MPQPETTEEFPEEAVILENMDALGDNLPDATASNDPAHPNTQFDATWTHTTWGTSEWRPLSSDCDTGRFTLRPHNSHPMEILQEMAHSCILKLSLPEEAIPVAHPVETGEQVPMPAKSRAFGDAPEPTEMPAAAVIKKLRAALERLMDPHQEKALVNKRKGTAKEHYAFLAFVRSQQASGVKAGVEEGWQSYLLVGAVPFLRNIVVNPTDLLNPLFEAMRTLGTAYLPTVLMVLAGSLGASASAGSKEEATPQDETRVRKIIRQAKSSQPFALQVLCIYAARFLLMLSLAFSAVGLSSHYFPSVNALFKKDPLLLLVLLLEACMPSAQNTTVILQLQQRKNAAGRLARVLMVLYVLGLPAMSYWLIHILGVTGLAV
ncbi:hypothetical protein B484DRAFT_400890 [Ochromonadaceae sp. CCMP2298]|nr:hypothetical protein B484DRAFT_400890 [Ochromonadaceae sp. CCMP2298]